MEGKVASGVVRIAIGIACWIGAASSVATPELPFPLPPDSPQACAARIVVAGRAPHPHGRYDEVASDLVSQPSLELLDETRARTDVFESEGGERRLVVTVAVPAPPVREKSYVVPFDPRAGLTRADAIRIGGRTFWVGHHPFLTVYPMENENWDYGIYLFVGDRPDWRLYLGLRRVGYWFLAPETSPDDTDDLITDPDGTRFTRAPR